MLLSRKKRKSYCDEELENGNEMPTSISFDEQVEDFLIKTRRLLLVGMIDEVVAAYICSYLQTFSSMNDKEPIYLYINSPGGCLSSGYAIIDQMSACRCPVYTIIRGLAHSMGAIIAIFGQEKHRYLTPNSSIMLHSPIVHNSPDSIERHAEMITHFKEDHLKKVADMAKRSKLTVKQLTDLMERTKWMEPEQAIKFGLIDAIWTPNMEQKIIEVN